MVEHLQIVSSHSKRPPIFCTYLWDILYLTNCINIETTCDSSDDIAVGCGLDSQGSIPARGRNFSLLHSVHCSSGDHTVYCLMGNGASFPGGGGGIKCETYHLPQFSGEMDL
jgi:hypothetical protein